MKRLLLLPLAPISAYAAVTPSTVTISPAYAVIKVGSSLAFSATCTYPAGTAADNCAAAGGVTITSARAPSGDATMSGSTLTVNSSASDQEMVFVEATAGGVSTTAQTRGTVQVQGANVTWDLYPTPNVNSFTQPLDSNTDYSGVVAGAKVAVGIGLIAHGQTGNGNPFNGCAWTSSNPSIAAFLDAGTNVVTALAPGSATLTCGGSTLTTVAAGNGSFGSSSQTGWTSPGTVIPIKVVAGGTSSQTWYVRPDGGTPYVSSSQTPSGQCDGLGDAAYPGSGVNQHCAMGQLEYLWLDQVTYGRVRWMIAGGDTVIVRQSTAQHPYYMGATASNGQPNCPGDIYDCHMPPIPSGSATAAELAKAGLSGSGGHHTRILGENAADTLSTAVMLNDITGTSIDVNPLTGISRVSTGNTSEAKRVNILGSYQNFQAFTLANSQFVDVEGFFYTQTAQCGGTGNYTNSCTSAQSAGTAGAMFRPNAWTSYVNLVDDTADGITGDFVQGAWGAGFSVDNSHSRGTAGNGLDGDDAPYNISNISSSGGISLTRNLIEFTNCIEYKGSSYNVPMLECREQSAGNAAGDAIGTGTTTGDWYFNGNTTRYTYQDGIDLLHSQMRKLVIINNQSYGNDGQAYKIGSGQDVIFENNYADTNCDRILTAIGDDPVNPTPSNASGCRANDSVVISLARAGKELLVEGNTLSGYQSVTFDMIPESGADAQGTQPAIFRNNIVLGWNYNGHAQLPGLFYTANTSYLANQATGGWTTRDHNTFFNMKACPSPLYAGETCSDPLLTSEPTNGVVSTSNEGILDNFTYALTSGSPDRGAGSAANYATDITGASRASTPSIGALEASSTKTAAVYGPLTATAAAPTPSPTLSSIAISPVGSTVTVGKTLQLSCTATYSDSSTQSCTSTATWGSSNSAVFTVSSSGLLTAMAAGTANATASYSGQTATAAETAAAAASPGSPVVITGGVIITAGLLVP